MIIIAYPTNNGPNQIARWPDGGIMKFDSPRMASWIAADEACKNGWAAYAVVQIDIRKGQAPAFEILEMTPSPTTSVPQNSPSAHKTTRTQAALDLVVT